MTPLVRRADVVLHADPSRVVARLFIPGNELSPSGDSRAGGVIERVLALPEAQVESLAADVWERWGTRHRDLGAALDRSFEQVAHRLPPGPEPSPARRTLISAYFTQEQSIEGAALFNPSLVPHPDQSGLEPGQLRFVMSLRAVGEGHVSCIELRTGVLGPAGQLHVDAPGPHAEIGTITHGTYSRELFRASLADHGADAEAAVYLVSHLPETFDMEQLDRALVRLDESQHNRRGGLRTDALVRQIARCTYRVEFDAATTVAERVLRPHGPTESQGMEDARFVQVVDDGGSEVYKATYTAFDGLHIAPQLLQTDDFRTFRVSVLAGPAAVDKGMALFPRTVGGRHLALTRADRETTGISSSANGYYWEVPTPLHGPSRSWDMIQTGNCGSPVETDDGWLVIMHGVGPMREYVIGAILLDLDDPTTVVGELDEPLLRPQEDEREGYVPTVVYSCGSLRNGDVLLLPYGTSDASVRFAVVDLPQLLDRLTGR